MNLERVLFLLIWLIVLTVGWLVWFALSMPADARCHSLRQIVTASCEVPR